MSADWPLVSYQQWQPTCDTLHAHTQVLGKLAARLAPPEPELLHAGGQPVLRRARPAALG
jgi:hypothetical protein